MKVNVLFLFVLFYSFSSCKEKDDLDTVETIVGEWELLSRTYQFFRDGKEEKVKEDYSNESEKEYLIFYDNGKGEIRDSGDIEKFTYSIQGKNLITHVEGEPEFYTEIFELIGGVLTIMDDPASTKEEKLTEVYKRIK
jgi:hypothetical protein